MADGDGPDENDPEFNINDPETWPLRWPDTVEGIKYCELVSEPASPEIVFRNDGTTLTKTIVVPWANLNEMKQFLGYPTVLPGVTDPSIGYISRTTPWYYADFENRESKKYLFATQISRCVPWGVPDRDANGWSNMKSSLGTAQYKYAKLTMMFETLTYDVLTDQQMIDLRYTYNGSPDESSLARYVTKIVKPAGQYLTLPPGSFLASIPSNYADGTARSAIVPGTPGKIVVKYDMSLTWQLVPKSAVGTLLINPGLTTPTIDLALGTVNKDTFAGCPPGTLLLTAANIKPIRSATGDRIYDIEYRISFFQPLTGGQTRDAAVLPAIPGAGHQFVYLPNFSLASVSANPPNPTPVVTPPPPPSYYEIVVSATPGVAVSNISISGTPAVNTLGLPGKNVFDWSTFANLFRVPS